MSETSVLVLGPPSAQRDIHELLARRHSNRVLVCEDCTTVQEGLHGDRVRHVLVVAKSDDGNIDDFLTQVRNVLPHVPVFFIEAEKGETFTRDLSRYGIVVLPSNLPATQIEQVLFPVSGETSSQSENKVRTITIERAEYPAHLIRARALFESEFITAALQRERGNVSKTAQTLRIARRNLQLKAQRYKIDIARIRREL